MFSLVKKSWFGSLTNSTSVDREETFCITIVGRSLNGIKAELIRAFLTINELSHSVVGQTSFRVEYKRGSGTGGSMFSRGVRMQVRKAWTLCQLYELAPTRLPGAL